MAGEIEILPLQIFCQKLGFIGCNGVRKGRLHGDPIPMFLGIETIAAALD